MCAHFMRKRPLDAETIRKLIESGLPEARVDVQGEDGVHFEATVVSPAFVGKAPLAATAWSTPPWAS